jgi:glycosyltransferase involved in cell wall biosynthesis
MRKGEVTFVLPGGGPSGGVRVTVEMARRLASRGRSVRIAYRVHPLLTTSSLLERAKAIVRRILGTEHDNWLHHFHGEKAPFVFLNDLEFSKGEFVIAVGEHAAVDVYELQRDVVKVRYCHGFFDDLPELNRRAWGTAMPTIAVSPALIPRLESSWGAKVMAVVPNALDESEYYTVQQTEQRTRDGLGLVYHNIPVKGPEVANALVDTATKCWPDVPWHCFGTARRPPSGLSRRQYYQYPSPSRARELYNRCKIWLVTSRSEGFCLPILEAMACGCAVISSDHLNASQLIQDGVNGFIVPFGDTDAYLRRIELLLKNNLEREEIVRKGLETVKQFTWERAVTKMEQVLNALSQGCDGLPATRSL